MTICDKVKIFFPYLIRFKSYFLKLFQLSPFIGCIGGILFIGQHFFGASPFYTLIGLGVFFLGLTCATPNRFRFLAAFPLILLYYIPFFELYIACSFLFGICIKRPNKTSSDWLLIALLFFGTILHPIISFLYVAFLFVPNTQGEEESQDWGTSVSCIYSIILAMSSCFPFLWLRTSFSPQLPHKWFYIMGILGILPIGFLFIRKKWFSFFTLIAPLSLFFLIGPLQVYLNNKERPYLFEEYTLLGIAAFVGLILSFSIQKLSRFSYLGFGLGLIFSAYIDGIWGYWLCLAYFFLVFFSNRTSHKIVSIAAFSLLIFGIFSSRGPTPDLYLQNLFRSRENSTLTFDASFWNAKGNYAIAISQEIPTYFDQDTPSRYEVEGAHIILNDRRSTAERYASLIVRNMHPNPLKMVIFGDTTANTLIHIHHQLPESLLLSTPIPSFTQMMAKQNPERHDLLISPEIQLLPYHPQEIIQQISNVDIMLDIIHSPFPNSINHPNSKSRLLDIQKTLSKTGIYAQLIHTRDFPDQSPQQQALLIAENFPYVQLWLPPQGADSLLIIASQTAFSWSSFSSRLEGKGFDIMEISSLAIGNKESTIQWGKHKPNDWLYPLQPRLHLASLSSYIPSPSEIWIDPPEELTSRLDIKKRFLTILQKAGNGQVNEVFQEASALFQNEIDPSLTLAPLIAPHIKDAQKSIERARSEGQTSKHWEDAQKYAMTAMMLAPQNPIPKGLLGEIAIGQGFPIVARKHFQEILAKNPKNMIGIHGMTRIAGLENNMEEVEKWLNEAVVQGAHDWKNHHNLGIFYQQQGKLTEAEQNFKKALSLAPKESMETRLLLSEVYLDQGEATRALLEIERIIKIKSSAKAWFLRGRAYFALESWKEAEDDFRRATLADPQYHDARGAIGYVKLVQGDLEGAAQAFRSTLRFDPNNDTAQQNLKLVEKELAKQPIPPK